MQHPFPHLTRSILIVLALLAMPACLPTSEVSAGGCRPLGSDKATLLQLKENAFEIADPKLRERFAFDLLECLGDPDPEMRDGIAYEAFVSLLRGKQLDPATIRQLRVALLGYLSPGEADPLGFRRPFAALALAEVARADRIEPLFTDEQRAELVTGAALYMRGIDDYRGFDEKAGWRHGIAHTADLLMQLALNPALTRPQLIEIRDAIAAQIAPPGEHFYVYGEPRRLARPIIFIAARGEFSEQEWTEWFATLASPAPFQHWAEVWSTQSGLAKLHNTRAFAQTIHGNATASATNEPGVLATGALNLLRALP